MAKTSFKKKKSAVPLKASASEGYVHAADKTSLEPNSIRTKVMTIKINDFEYDLIKQISNLRMTTKSAMVKQVIAEEARRLGLYE